MLKLLFDRKSPVVLVAEIAGVLAFAVIFLTVKMNAWFVAYFVGYVLIRFCASWKWNGSGISSHFQKTLVPAAYLTAFTNLLVVFKVTNALVYFSLSLMTGILYVDAILIYFYLKDNRNLTSDLTTEPVPPRGV